MTEKEFAQKKISEIKEKLRIFPVDFLEKNGCKSVELPGEVLVLGPELFGSYELMNRNGDPLIKVEDIYEAKYILYSNRTKPDSVDIPQDPEKIIVTVKNYERYLDELLEKVQREFKKTFPESKSFFEISNYIFNSLNLKRH